MYNSEKTNKQMKPFIKVFIMNPFLKILHLFTSCGVWAAELNTMRHSASRKLEVETHFCQKLLLKAYMVTYPLSRQAENSSAVGSK